MSSTENKWHCPKCGIGYEKGNGLINAGPPDSQYETDDDKTIYCRKCKEYWSQDELGEISLAEKKKKNDQELLLEQYKSMVESAQELFIWCFIKIIPAIEDNKKLDSHDISVFKLRMDQFGEHIYGHPIYFDDSGEEDVKKIINKNKRNI